MADTLTPPAQLQRHSGTFSEPRLRRRFAGLIVVLVAGALLVVALVMLWNNPMPVGTQGFWAIVEMRAADLVVIAVVVLAQAFATLSFQTVTSNRLITPSIMGFESLYVVIQTAMVFFFGASGVAMLTGTPQFLLQATTMVLFATLLYTWLLGGRLGNLHVMLLVGVILGGGLRSLSTFMQRMLNPNEFDVLTARMFGNIANARTEHLPYAVPIVLITAAALWWRARRLNVMALGRETATNLGLDHKRELITTLVLVSVLMAMATSLVGPMTFLGFLIVTIAYSVTDTHDHRALFAVSTLLGFVTLGTAYFILRHVFYAAGAVTILIELIGGVVFLIVVLRKGRL